jgi:hypothetical protein
VLLDGRIYVTKRDDEKLREGTHLGVQVMLIYPPSPREGSLKLVSLLRCSALSLSPLPLRPPSGVRSNGSL